MTTREDLKQLLRWQVIDEVETGDNETINKVLEHLTDDELYNCLYDWRQKNVKR